MTAQDRAAAHAMYRALGNLPCCCSHNVPYAGCPTPQVVTKQCGRCAAMAQWEAVLLEAVA